MLQRTFLRFGNSAGLAFAMFMMLCVPFSSTVFGQAPSQGGQSKLPEFEVASVRPSKSGEMNGFYTYPGGRIVGHGVRLDYLVMIAYNIPSTQLSGGPSWIDGEPFDMEAKPPASSKSAHWETNSPKILPGEEERQMLQSLLADRFQLRFHREAKNSPIYILSKSNRRLKLTTPKDTKSFPWAGGGTGGGLPNGDGLRGRNITMPEFASRLTDWLQRPVIDKTGLTGSYDFEIHSGEGDSNSDMDVTTSILVSLKGLGLKLQSAKGMVETLVIDHVERPTQN